MDPIEFKQIINEHYIVKEPVNVQGGLGITNIRLVPRHSRPCLDCSRVVAGRVEIYLKRRLESDNPYWIKKCSECSYRVQVARPFDTGLK